MLVAGHPSAALPGPGTRFKVPIRCRSAVDDPAGVLIRTATLETELQEVARLRAAAYHENQSSRFRQSFIKQFAEQEYRRLAAATSADRGGGATLAALDDAGRCVGTLDVRPGFTPGSCSPGAYVANVVVAPECRRRGLGTQLVEAAKAYAAGELGAALLYAHVETTNDAAGQMYGRCGFHVVGTDGGVAAGSVVGQRLLLRCELRREPCL